MIAFSELFLILAVALSAPAKAPAGAIKTVDTFDATDVWDCTGTLSPVVVDGEGVEGSGCCRFTFDIPEGGDALYWQRIFVNYRCDFSFHPLALSIWLKGNRKNDGVFRLTLLEGDMTAKGKDRQKVLKTYSFSDANVLRSRKWTRLVVPFDEFRAEDGSLIPDLTKIIGWRMEVAGKDGKSASGSFLADWMQQMTTYQPSWNPEARFSSIVVQLTPAYAKTDWEKTFRQAMEVGINEWLVQFCIQRRKDGKAPLAYFKNCTLPFTEGGIDIVDRMFEAAEKLGVRLVIGSSYESWVTRRLRDPQMYEEICEKNLMVVDELAAKFGDSPAFAGWYIPNEFQDGSKISFVEEDVTPLLAGYLEKVASHMKSRKNVDVCIAPALWRGYPAVMTADYYDRIFTMAPSLDILYIQDCGGRGPDVVTSVSVDLPNYYEKIKAVCDRHGVRFGVDLESFRWSRLVNPERRPKTWEELREALEMAGNYTDLITNFSWVSFQPGQEAFEQYRKTLGKKTLEP